MTVHGFGGTIETGATASARTYADSRTNAPLAEGQLLARFGHRHRSAFLLCKAVPNALAFVISQDGDLPVFSSDERHVYCDENLSP
jgi:DNA integrity scanning protein DisA with diadenylate cyclase activity